VKLQALAALAGAALVVCTCYAAGALLIARLGSSLRRVERFPLAFVLGAACVHLALFALFALKVASKPVLLTFAFGTMAAALLDRRASFMDTRSAGMDTRSAGMDPRSTGIDPRSMGIGVEQKKFLWSDNLPAIGYATIFVIFTALYFVNAWAPEASSDGSGYHLELVARYVRAHGFERVTTNMYAGLGQGAEMLYALAFAFGGHSSTALVHFSFAIALAALMLAYGFKMDKWWVGAGAALLVYLSPVVGRDATTAYIDVISAGIGFSIFYWLELWEESRNDRLLIAVGLLCGYAYATKYTGVVMLPYALVFVVWRKVAGRKHGEIVKPLLLISACAAVMILPWMVKDWVFLRDPVAPFGASIFRTPYIHVSTISEWGEYLRSYDLPSKAKLPLDLTIHGSQVQGIIGPVFLAAPLALFALRYRAGRRLLLAGAVMLVPYFANVGARFLIPGLPFFAMAMTLAIGSMPRLVAALVLFQAIASWPPVLVSYADPHLWRISDWPFAGALRRESEDSFLRHTLGGYAEARMIEDHVPPGGRVLAEGAIATSYTTREVLINFQGAFNQLLTDVVDIGWYDGFRPKSVLVFRFPEREIRRIRLLQTAQLPRGAQWSVHEVRYLCSGAEFPRSPEWKLRAFPNSWDVQLAFDNSPVTRWKTWETPAPGMFIETDFVSDRAVDEVRVEATDNDRYYRKTLQVEVMDARGQWVKVADQPEELALAVPPWLRRAATHELHIRGVDYLMMQDGEAGANDLADDPDAWGVVAMARTRQSTLYKITPEKTTP
jgi:hypothetical protein